MYIIINCFLWSTAECFANPRLSQDISSLKLFNAGFEKGEIQPEGWYLKNKIERLYEAELKLDNQAYAL